LPSGAHSALIFFESSLNYGVGWAKQGDLIGAQGISDDGKIKIREHQPNENLEGSQAEIQP